MAHPGKLVFTRRRIFGGFRAIEYAPPVVIPEFWSILDLPSVALVDHNPRAQAFDGSAGDATETNPTVEATLNP